MKTKFYGFDDAMVKITERGGKRIQIFDVSPTTECRWIAITENVWSDALYVFPSTDEMLEFVAKKQLEGCKIPNDDKWLDDQVQGNGFDSWELFVKEQVQS